MKNTAPRILDFSSSRGMLNLIKRGMGITVCPEVAVEKELSDRSLVRLPWDLGGMQASVLMIWHAEKWCSPVLGRFMEIAREVLGNYSDPETEA